MSAIDRLQQDRIWCEEVIISTAIRRGSGTTGDPIRLIVQVFLKDGSFIAEYDPFTDPKNNYNE